MHRQIIHVVGAAVRNYIIKEDYEAREFLFKQTRAHSVLI